MNFFNFHYMLECLYDYEFTCKYVETRDFLRIQALLLSKKVMKVAGFLFALGTIVIFHANAQIIEPTKPDDIGCISQQYPSFPGGLDSLKSFVSSNLKYPKGAGDSEGRVFVSFVVNEDGSLTDIRIVKSLCEEFDKCAIDVVRKMPKWIPGKQANMVVKSKMFIPIHFHL